MCGRFTLTASKEALHHLFPLFDVPELNPRYNVAPTQSVLAVRVPTGQHAPSPALLHWGLIPSWADDPALGNRLINARAETAATKPAFRTAFRQNRCLILADGFYEWKKVEGSKLKQPFHIGLKDSAPFAFAGLAAHWSKGETPIDSCTILTTEANELMSPLHHRMPVILDPGDFEKWLDPTQHEPEPLQALLLPFPSDKMTAFPVSTYVNNVRNQGPACVAPSPA